MRSIIYLPIVAFAVLLSGCVSQSKSLAESDWQVPRGRDVVVVVPQAEAGIHIDPTTAQALPQTGLIGALVAAAVDSTIDGVRAHRGESAIGPIRNALVGYDFDERALSAMKDAMDRAPWFDVKAVTLTRDGTSQSFSKLMVQSSASQVLYTCFTYAFSPDLETLRVDLKATILQKTPEPTTANVTCERIASRKALYYHAWFYRENLGLARDADANARLWAEDGAVRVRGAVEAGVSRLVRMLMTDLYQVPAQPSSTTTAQASSDTASTQMGRRGPAVP